MSIKTCWQEKEILAKIEELEMLIELVNREISKQLKRKSIELNIEVTQDLKEKCSSYLAANEKAYSCKVCLKAFSDGRQLGGHVSRAHKTN